MVESTLANMLDAFSSDNIVEFDATGPEDEDQAQLESDTVTHFVMKEQNGFLQLAAAIKDALLLRNGIVKVWIEESKRTYTREFVNVAPEALPTVTASGQGLECEVKHYDPGTGELKVRCTQTTKKFRSEALAPENFLYLKSWDSLDVQDIPFCAERHIDPRSDLVGMGFPKAKVKELKAYGSNYKNDDVARNPRKRSDNDKGIDTSQDPIEWFECYALIDSDGDGISERHRVCISGDVILADDLVKIVPYAVGVAILNPHRMLGISQYDKLRQVQDEHTALKRARADNINATTKNRLAYLDGKVNTDDVSDGRPNGAIRVKGNVPDIRAALMPFAVPDTSIGINASVQELLRERSELGGAALELATGQMQIGGDRMGSQGLDRAYSVVEQLAAMMTKNVAATLIRSTFLLAHATLRENFDVPVPIKRNGKWFSPVPSEWQERNRLTVKVGMSPGERARRVAALDKILANQVQLAQLGMDEVLVNLDGFYKAMMDRDRASDLPHPEQYYVDPQSDQAKQAMQIKTKQAAEQREQQKALMQQAIGLEQLRTAFDKYKQDTDLQFKYWDAVLKSEVAEAQIAGAATVEMVKAKDAPAAKESSKPKLKRIVGKRNAAGDLIATPEYEKANGSGPETRSP